jgi:hypothetical protein
MVKSLCCMVVHPTKVEELAMSGKSVPCPHCGKENVLVQPSLKGCPLRESSREHLDGSWRNGS